MKYGVSDLPALLSTSFGRAQLSDGIQNVLWPVFYLAARLYRMMTCRLTSQVVVIGSLGKTTSYRALASVLGTLKYRKYYRNFKTPIARRILEVPPWRKFGVTEVGIDRPGQMETFARMIKPDVVVATSIASEHNRSLKSLDTTRFEKSRMLAKLGRDGLAIINGDDPNVLWMRTQTKARVVTCGFNDSSDFRALNYRLDWPHGSSFDIQNGSRTWHIRSRLIGRHTVYPMITAMAFTECRGIGAGRAIPSLESLEPAKGRLQTVRLPGGAFLIRDDFKSSLETIHSALDVLSEVPAAHRGIILGDVSEPPGSQGPLYREIGSRVAAIADWAVFYGGKRHDYASGARAAGMPGEAIEKVNERLVDIAANTFRRLHPGDVVLIKGRSNQKLERISLAMMGRTVKCDLKVCKARTFRCDDCPMLERGWSGKKVII